MGSNTLNAVQTIAREGLRHLVNESVFIQRVHRAYQNEFVKNEYRLGDTVLLRKPVKFSVTNGKTLTRQSVTESTVSIAVDTQKHVGWDFDSKELTLSVREYSERYIKPAAIALAGQLDDDMFSLYKDVHAAVGTAGSAPTRSTLDSASQKQMELGVPIKEELYCIVNPAGKKNIADSLTSLQNPPMVESSVRRNYIGRVADYTVFASNNVIAHTAGTRSGTPIVSVGSQSGTSLITGGWTGDQTVLKAGDIFTISGVNAVNPVYPFRSTGQARQFTITSDVASNGAGSATLTFTPAITLAEPYKTVDALPLVNAAISTVASHTANLAYHPNAFALVMPPMAMPDGVSFKARAGMQGINIRILKDFDITNDVEIIRMDILYAKKTIYPELACRVFG